jgi:hypothetical protein
VSRDLRDHFRALGVEVEPREPDDPVRRRAHRPQASGSLSELQPVTKGRHPEEDAAVDAVDAFVLYKQGWLLDPETHRVRHPEKHPHWTTLGGALDFEMAQPDPLPDPVPGVTPPHRLD